MQSRDSTDPAVEIVARLRDRPIKAHEIGRFLDGLSHDERVASIRSLGRAEQRALYAAVDGVRPVGLSDLVPSEVDDFAAVRHFGKNTLPAFTHFEKRFCRPRGADRGHPDEIYGFNFQTLAPITGPGYFVARVDENRSEVLVDYRTVPAEHPEGWPEIRVNERGISRFVYGFMVDTLRGVSTHVTIGSAARNGKDLGSWFILCREE